MNPGLPAKGMKEPGEIPITPPHVERGKGRETEAVDMLQCKPRLRDKLFVQTPDRAFITRCLVMLYLRGQCLVAPDAQEHLAKEVTQQATTGTRLAAAVTTISYPRELVW